MDKGMKILTKMLAGQIQQHIRIMRTKSCSTFENQGNTILSDKRKAYYTNRCKK